MEFDWDEANRDHMAGHGVDPEEAEEALLDSRRRPEPAYNTLRERRWAALGRTEYGRLLFVVFTRRGTRLRVISARDATNAEKHRYQRQGGR